ncbi:hypothetical protein LEP1GSC086_3575 [Leptospira weilii str. LNT 1234]|nr:hypothetical protein LEP1GSC086_3575 [Leptospira weilii str. LNT 1234]
MICSLRVVHHPPPKIREGRKFHRGFVGIPTDLSSDPSIWWGYVRE